MKKDIDLRGLLCPEPVLKTKKILDDQTVTSVEALVDSEVNIQNLARLARSQNFGFKSAAKGEHFVATISKEEVAPNTAPEPPAAAKQSKAKSGVVIFISKDRFGEPVAAPPGEEHEKNQAFSLNLLNVFLQTISQSGHDVQAVLLANSGVRLMDPESPCVKVLDELKEKGVEVLACGLCLDYYGLKEKVKTEQITNMYAICEYLFAAEKVLSP
ncbi:MAG: sulfurtransferase-like selenium metabolism protein YedF [Candidatus Melainabacteria bacterium]|nr:sulfurtransferase-like selenium metabolism protein YedF [Candidatus Melainabacteria bacterium]